MAGSLEGCWAKIERAKLHHASLKAEINKFIENTSQDIQHSCYHSEDGLRIILRATTQANVPKSFSVIIGEIVHQLRSSLDHLLYELVKQAGNTPTRGIQFPICTAKDLYNDQVKRGRIRGISVSAAHLIELAQPYHSSPPEDSIILVVSELNNWDKHNALVVSAAAAQVGEEITIGTDAKIFNELGRAGEKPAIVGFSDPAIVKFKENISDFFFIRLGSPAPEITASCSIALSVVLEIDASGRVFPAIELLDFLIRGIEGTLRSFSSEFQ